jgi:DNA-binding response OmpR family regulator
MKEAKKKVMIVDDEKSIVEALSIMLEEEGYEVLATTNAHEVKKLIKLRPNLLLLDIWMSGFSGEEICMQLKSKAETKNIPIIIFSANRDTHVIASKAGADDFITKPFEMQAMLDKVASYIGTTK